MDDRLIADLKASYGIACRQVTPVTGGYLNLKWRVSADTGEVLVKQYAPQRYNRKDLDKIETRLRRQILLRERGVPCPRLWRSGGRIIRWLDDAAYMVMEFCPGGTERPDTITAAQLYSLGEACALMHGAFAQLPEPADKTLPGYGGYATDALRANYEARLAECGQDAAALPPNTAEAYRRAVYALEPVLGRLDPGLFDRVPKGYAHEDLQAGNILFDARGVTAIVDFDRNCYSYVWHDIGRALLSFALEGDALNVGKVRAFREGYTRHAPLSMGDIADALRITWCIETPWWIRPEFFGECGEIPARFRDEMLWLSAHWPQLDAIVGA